MLRRKPHLLLHRDLCISHRALSVGLLVGQPRLLRRLRLLLPCCFSRRSRLQFGRRFSLGRLQFGRRFSLGFDLSRVLRCQPLHAQFRLLDIGRSACALFALIDLSLESLDVLDDELHLLIRLLHSLEHGGIAGEVLLLHPQPLHSLRLLLRLESFELRVLHDCLTLRPQLEQLLGALDLEER